jgi:hypothetical protein
MHYEKAYHKGKLHVHMREWSEEYPIDNMEILDDWIIIIFQVVAYYIKTYPLETKRTIYRLMQVVAADYKGKKNKIQYSAIVSMFRWMTRPAEYPAIDNELLTNANAHASTCNYSYAGVIIVDP